MFKVIKLGSPVLRQIAKFINNVNDTALQKNVDELKTFVINRGGMGIAAPQVGISQRFFIMSSHPNERYPYAPEMPITIVINPEIIWHSEQMEKGWEGCLSVPQIRGNVPRYTSIKVRYFTEQNQLIETQFDGFLARIFQHELDHLDGRLFIDRVESTLDLMSEEEWLKQLAENTLN
jgi:peptide deformylase